MKVLVVGAGPTGLTAALELARRGVEVEVIEKRAGPSSLSRAVGILPAAVDVLRPSGAAEAILREAVPFSSFLLHEGDRLLGALPMSFDDRSTIWGLAQDRTEHHLAEALGRHGAGVRYDAPLEELTRDADGVTTRAGGVEGRHDYLVAADGVRSAVRGALGIAYEGFDLPGEWSIADVVSTSWPDPTAFHTYLLPRGQVTVVAPLEPARFRVVSSLPDALGSLPVPMEAAEVRRTGRFVVSVRRAASHGGGRVFLAGDAAHCHSPAGGRGMNLGIADAGELAARMVEGRLDGYAASRHAAGARAVALSERARRAVMSGPAGRAALRASMRVMKTAPPIARIAVRQFASR